MSEWEAIGKSDEWYTPKYIFDALNCCFDLDVAAPNDGPRHVPCFRWFSSNALDLDWEGFVWMNPPFGGRNAIDPWLKKFFEHGKGIALVPDRTSAPWFQNNAKKASAILFLAPKVKFERPDGRIGKSPGSGTALFAAGNNGANVLRQATKLGLLVENVEP